MTPSDGSGNEETLGEPSQGVALGVDIGGTKVSGGAVDSTGRVLLRSRRDTPDRSRSPSDVEDALVEVIDELCEGLGTTEQVIAVGIGAAGFVDAARATVVFSPHLSWRQEPLKEAIGGRVRLPVVVENDANAAAWAEHRFGVGQGEEHLVMVTLGTGIGGAAIIAGALDRGRFGAAGEFGHMQVVPDGQRCECGNRGCWEQYASGNALVREASALVASRSPVAADLAARVAGDPGGLTGPLITQAATEGDPTAMELLAEVGTWLGVGFANLAAALDPGLFVVGGGVSAAGELLLGPARAAFRRRLPGRGYRPEARIVPAALGNDAGLVGAAALARREVLGGD